LKIFKLIKNFEHQNLDFSEDLNYKLYEK
jgi:hypothetical protein